MYPMNKTRGFMSVLVFEIIVFYFYAYYYIPIHFSFMFSILNCVVFIFYVSKNKIIFCPFRYSKYYNTKFNSVICNLSS